MKKINWGKKALPVAIGLVVILGFVWGYRSISRPMISVVMSTYNRAENYLPKAIDSILNQTYGDFEFIIINDGSPDNTAEVLEEYRRKDSRIRIITNEKNLGLIPSLNKGFDAARGKYIARMDDDDISLSTRFEKQIHYLENHPELTATSCSYRNIERPQLYSFPEDPEEAKCRAFMRVPALHPCLMIRRNFVEKNQIRYRKRYQSAEDLGFWFDVVLRHKGLISSLQEILIIKSLTSPKKSEYLFEQSRSTYRYQRDSFNYFLSEDKKRCRNLYECYQTLYESGATKDFIDQKRLHKWIQDLYRPEGSIVLHHLSWVAPFVFEDENRLISHRKIQDNATILEKGKDFIKLKWDHYGVEKFVYDPKKDEYVLAKN